MNFLKALIYYFFKPKIHYCIVRSDLPSRTIAAQLIHAAGESRGMFQFLPEHTIAVCLAVPTEKDLLEWEQKLLKAKIRYKAIREPDSPYYNQLMVIGIRPASPKLLKPFFNSLKTYR